MTPSDVSYTIRSFFCLIDNGQFDLLGHFVTPGYAMHFAGIPDPLNLAGATQVFAGFLAAFPDMRHNIEQMAERDGRIELQVAVTGTHRGDFQGAPASGRPVRAPTHIAFRFEDGQIAEHWVEADLAEIMRQIGGGPAAARNGHAGLEANKALVRRVYDELINQENKVVIDETFAEGAIIHDEFTGVTVGREAFRQLLGIFDAAFPHHRVVVEAVLAEGDLVSVLHTHHAIHTGPFLHLAPTGKSVEVNGLDLYRIVDGQIVEFWRKDDHVSLLMQLGAMPAPQAT